MARISNPLWNRPSYSNNKKGGWFSSRVVIHAIIAAFLLAALFVWHSQLAGVFWSLAAPIQRARIQFDASDNQRLRGELASTTALLADRNALYQENLELKARLGRDAGLSIILAGVLLHPPATPYDTFIIDAGSAEGVHQNDIVTAGGTARIGTVGDVYLHTSRVVLFSAPGQTYNVLLRGSVPVEMQGQGSGSFTGQVPSNTIVAEGDTLIFPGIMSGFAGVVSHVETKEGSSFKTVFAHLPVNPLSLQFVDVQKDSYAQQ